MIETPIINFLIGVAITYSIGFITGYFAMWVKHIQIGAGNRRR